MAKPNSYLFEINIDRLTDSILNRISGDSFRTEVSLLTKSDLKNITKKSGWLFDWKYEFGRLDREIYKLTIVDNLDIIQGLISLTIKPDHVYMFLLESAPFNLGNGKIYEGVPGNLVAFACKLSFQRGGEGFVSFESKTKLIEHYTNTLGALHIGGGLMIIDSKAAEKLVLKYFKP
ncbi:hypothetical protein [Salmonirosea aquatica]|uniref:N-acetyltransferase n=1 Tax=Salmonirosea aquatica TaxID=2654236 RepID=A0A7C9FF68_9BACT|nr:hypothetical protein [Cytophagaceae bacterium SJW1-29]